MLMMRRDATEYSKSGRKHQSADTSSLYTNQPEYQPLRVHIHHSPGSFLDVSVQEILRKAVEKAVQRITSVLSVMPVKGPLLLSRSSACPFVFKDGVNRGKCSRLKKGYYGRGERCLNIFKIPDAHLEGVSIYNKTHPEPVHEIFKPGPGVNDSDLILYVIIKATKPCQAQGRSVLAFASHCQVDEMGRPVAGLINFCLFTLIRSTPSQHLLYTTALHEILHVLGFSTKLFSSFKECKDGTCKKRPATVRSVKGQLRLVSPVVVNKTRQHFGCATETDFGGPLEEKNSQPTSHWDSGMMHTSLMTARGDNSSYSLLDPVTLAVFEDSGWYRVNFSNADLFLWGKDAGCTFATTGYCEHSPSYFCSDNSSGCHFLYRDKAVCTTEQPTSPCGIYRPIAQGSCMNETYSLGRLQNSMETFSSRSRCFVSSLRPAALSESLKFRGQCYERWCSENGTVFVRVLGQEWTACPGGQTIQVSGLQGEIRCPQDGRKMCLESVYMQATQTSTTHNQNANPSPSTPAVQHTDTSAFESSPGRPTEDPALVHGASEGIHRFNFIKQLTSVAVAMVTGSVSYIFFVH